MTLKLSKTALRELTRLYRGVLVIGLTLTVFSAQTAMAAITDGDLANYTIKAAANEQTNQIATVDAITEEMAALIAQKEANISGTLGFDVSNNPANTEVPNSLVSKLTGEIAGNETSVVGAINALDSAVAQKANSADVYTKDEVNTLFNTAGGIGSTQIANDAVTADKIADDAVGQNHIANGAVGTAEIKNESITKAKLDTNLQASIDQIEAKANTADVYTKTEVDTKISETKTYAENKASTAEANARTYTNEQITAAKTYAEGQANTAETNAKAYAENKASTAEANAKAYTTEQITAAKTYADGKATAAETNAKAYTDTLANGAVKNNTDAIAVLNGDETVDGSVAKAVKTAETNANAYTDAQDAATLATAQADASAKATAAETNAKSYTDTLIGTTDVLVEQNGVIKLGTVNENIAALNDTIGDITDLNQYTEGASIGNALTQGGTQSADTVVAALNNIDATLGTIHGLRDKLAASGAGTNLASGTTVEQHLTALDSAIGNRAYTSTRYISSGSDLSSAVSTLDSNLSRVEGNLDALTRRTQKMHHEMKSGFASLAAMSALVPNARVAGDTQISVGTGHYRGTTGFALGAFHHVNDNILLNAGAAYGGNGSATFKGGLTFGW